MAVPARRWLLAILVVSYALRLALAVSGGQDFWPDEFRYGGSTNGLHSALQGEGANAVRELLGRPDHPFFRVVGLPAAILERMVGPRGSPALVAAYFSLYSTLAIFLVWAVARRFGASDGEAGWAAFFAATANTLFFYSRHYLPYDSALCFMLAALWVGGGAAAVQRSYSCGFLVGLGFLTYSGYWLLGGVVLVLHTLLGGIGWREWLRRGASAGAGLLTPVALWLLFGELLGVNLLAGSRSFAGTINQGDFGQGYRVVLEYFWHAEGLLAVLWLVAAGAGVVLARRGGWSRRLTWWLAGVGLVLGGLVLLSDALPVFVVYGRLARMVVPFLCLLAAFGVAAVIARLRPNRRAAAGLALATTVVGVAGMNFAAPLRQVFEPEFVRAAAAAAEQASAEHPGAAYRLVFAHGFWNRPLEVPELPPHDDVLRARHPMQYRPYQYEGITAAVRAWLNQHDPAMRLVRLRGTGDPLPLEWEGYPGPLRLTVKFPRGRPGEVQPLVATGRTGAGDVFYVRYLDDRHVSFGLDHWGGGGFASPPVELDFAAEHQLTLALGSLMPPSGAPVYEQRPVLAHLRSHALVQLNGQTVVSSRQHYHPTLPAQVQLGVNLVGGSVVSANFGGSIIRVEPAPADSVAPAVPPLVAEWLGRQRGPEWAGALGPVRLRFALPHAVVGAAIPLLSAGAPGSGEVVFVLQEKDGLVRLGYDRQGYGVLLSQPLLPNPAGVHEVDVVAGALMPGPEAPWFEGRESFRRLREGVQVRFNGQIALVIHGRFEAAGARVTLGANTVGSSVASAYFEGVWHDAVLLPADELSRWEQPFATVPSAVDPRWRGHSGPLRLSVQFPRGRAGFAEPLIVTGEPGYADFLYVRYHDDRHVQFGFDHWGSGGPLSELVEIQPDAVQELTISLGSLMPARGAPIYDQQPQLIPLREQIFVSLNGRVLLDQRATFHPASLEQRYAGHNPVGGSSADAYFRGKVHALARAAPEEVLGASGAARALQRPGWAGLPGPITLRVVFPPLDARVVGVGDPLITTGVTGGGDFLFVSYLPDGQARVGVDHWGAPLVWSEPFAAEPGREYAISVGLSSLFPPPESPLYQQEPALLVERERLWVRVGEQRVLDTVLAAHPATLSTIFYGHNPIGGSTALPTFTGELRQVELAEFVGPASAGGP